MAAWMARCVNVAFFVLCHMWEYRGLLHLTLVGALGYVFVRYTDNDRTYSRAAICHALVNMTFYTLANVHVLYGEVHDDKESQNDKGSNE